MQADGILDWVIFIVFTPFVPIAGFVHYSLGVVQATAILAAATWRLILSRTNPQDRPRLIRTAYLPFLLLPNITVVAWGILTDPAL